MGIDTRIRNLEKQMNQNPGDKDLKSAWLREKRRAGECSAETHFRVKKDDKFLSENGRTSYYTRKTPKWTPVGTKYSSKTEAVEALVKVSKRKGFPTVGAYVVRFDIHTIEEPVETDIESIVREKELEELQQKKEQIERQEKELIEKLNRQREHLLNREKKLLDGEEKGKKKGKKNKK